MDRNYRLLLAAGLAAAFFSAGCSRLNLFARKAPAAPAPAAPPAIALPDPDLAPPPSPLVNVFGEFDGLRRAPVQASSETSFQQHTACEEGYDADVSIDPTGKLLLFSSTRHSLHPDIYLQRVEGSAVVQLTSDPADDCQPAFSPDGKRIAFCSTRSGNWDLYLMDLDGKAIEQLTSGQAQDMHPSFSPDGSRLVYCSLSPRSDQWELWILNLATRERKMIGQGLFPTFCPRKDVERIAFQRARQRGSRWFSLWTLDLVAGEPRRLTEVAASANAALVWPTWSPDGQRLAFATILSPDGPSPDRARPRHDIWTVSADGSNRQRLTQGTGTNLSPFWAVDNRIFFVSDRGGTENIWSARVETTTGALAADDMGRGAPQEQTTTKPKGPAAESVKPAAVGAADNREVGH